jgi:hypothetical protein
MRLPGRISLAYFVLPLIFGRHFLYIERL